ncbi:hypothetical protein CAEBREN_24934 [Caenorhabditis brenneri]|uniref:Peptidase M13 C-terminal domain-containing protein n=1 Tax=Caenorhabditis brenneri TaxID=135651 RepID=G0NMW0_CAEBE|nr:hypothetical protein CAEBREN_24934 [Caenorhabditis brenneri]
MSRIPGRKTSTPPDSLVPGWEPEPEPEHSWTLAQNEVTSEKPSPICKSPECIHLAHKLHNYRDPTVDPCQDFYKAACGKYNEHTTVMGILLPEMKLAIRNLKILLKHFLQFVSSTETQSTLFLSETAGYRNEIARDQNDLKDLFQAIQTIGAWPTVTENWSESEFDLSDMMANVASLGSDRLGLFKVEVRFSLPVFFIWPVGTEFPAGYLEQSVKNIFAANNIKVDERVLEEDFKSFEALEAELSQLKYSPNASWGQLIEVQTHIPSVDFEKIFKSFMRLEGRDDMWNKIKDKITTINDPTAFESLETILKNSSKRTLANFIIFRYINLMTLYFSQQRKMPCEKEVVKMFPLASLRVFVRNHFDKQNLKMAAEMVEHLRKSYIEMFEQSTWLHEETREKAILKAKMMDYMIGYPEEFEKPGALDKTFKSVIIPKMLNLLETDSYFSSLTKICQFQMEQSVDYVAGLVGLIATEDLIFGASYQPLRNSLDVTVTILDDPMFDSTYPAYANIAGVGFIIGHEIGHGFDPNWRKMNEKGEKKDWWTNEDSIEYDKRAQCLIEKYNDYDDPTYGRNLNGSTTIGEVVADILGVETAWRTYKSLDMSNEATIFGFEDFGLDKLYFHIAALTWCSAREEFPLETKLTHPHATPSFRVNGVFSNMKVFAETFNCPIGSPMNPEKKCEMF